MPLGLAGVAVPGVHGWKREWRERFAGRCVAVLFDCDEAGRKAAARVASDLEGVVAEVRVVDLGPQYVDGFDVGDLAAMARTPQERRQARSYVLGLIEQTPKFFSASKESPVVERNLEGSLTLPFAPIVDDLDGDSDEPEWLCEGYVAPGAVTLWSGWPKVGKTTILFALLAALEKGEPFLGLATRSTGVLLLTEERKGTLASKVRRWRLDGVHRLRRHQAKDEPWPEIVRQANAYAHEHGLGLLVVDTLAEWARIVNENDAGEVLAAVRPLQEAAESGLGVVVASHQRKAPGRFGEAVRGSNALTGAVDIVVELERSHSFQEPNVRVLRAVSRYERTPDDLVAALTDDGYEARGDSATAKAEEESRRVLVAIQELGSANVEDLASATDLTESTARRRANALFEQELVGRTGAGKGNDPHIWHADFLSTTASSLLAGTNQTELEGMA